jgi:hypothetical protein
MARAELLVGRAMELPAWGAELAAWRARSLAELLVQAKLTGDDALVAAVDEVAPTLTAVPGRLAWRLRAVRRAHGGLPGSYPDADPGPATGRERERPPARRVRDAARRLARALDALDSPGAPAGEPASSQRKPAIRTGRDVERSLRTVAQLRPEGDRTHRCQVVPFDKTLIWRGWCHDGQRPVLAYTGQAHTPAELDMMYGLHAGVHLDHMAGLDAAGPGTAIVDIQFGGGLLVAEAVAMTVELMTLLAPRDGLAADRRTFLRNAVIDRISRTPGLATSLSADASRSPTLTEVAGRTPTVEFRSLPTLAAAYLTGPFDLAEQGFRHPLIPRPLAAELARRWQEAASHPGLSG